MLIGFVVFAHVTTGQSDAPSVTSGDGQVANANDVASNFSDAFDDTNLPGWFVAATGEALKRKSPPAVENGKLYLLNSWWKSSCSAALAATTEALPRQLQIEFELTMNTGTDGMGVAWLSTDEHGKTGPASPIEAWESPSFSKSFAVGLDASNPVNRDPFRGSGNAYDRPQHEVSIHFDGMEIVKRVSKLDFRDEQPHTVKIVADFVTGGTDVSVAIDDEIVFDNYFVAGMTPYHGRFAMGARNGRTAGDVLVDNLKVVCQPLKSVAEPPLHITAIDSQLNDVNHPETSAQVNFPTTPDKFARVICTLTLAEPEGGYDPWDRIAHVFVSDDEGQRSELFRYITPYDRGHIWKIDVTDFLPWLQGVKRIEQSCSTQGTGWVVSVSFDFYPGSPQRVPFQIIPLWSGSAEIGNPDKPVADFYKSQTIDVPLGASGAKIWTVVTGHGMNPNSNNAAEFMPIGRVLTVNDQAYSNQLWKSDNYLNPCRPQGGTWKYDRAGWAPGDVVRPWTVDVSHLIEPSGKLTIGYQLDDYVNENRGQTWAPFHLTESFLIFYRDHQPSKIER